MKVIKRDGMTVDFDRMKIVVAIQKANEAVEPAARISQAQIDDIADYVMKKGRARLLVEDIQDMVEQRLVALDKYDLAKAYIIYRYVRSLARRQNTTDEDILDLLHNSNKEMAEENSNKDTTVASTQRDY
ncbi:MAG: anaerobic ribonucleoside-triphosphate reductase, partial [Oscillospiraceae bacterium]|nr:anaerobic ribonucleoside-triphosphate reductase [Oscillospiraceae bacterium]